MRTINFSDIKAPDISYKNIATKYDALSADWDAATTPTEYVKVVQAWDDMQREIETWESLIYLHFEQETSNSEYQRMREYCDDLKPKLTDLAVNLKRKFLASDRRACLEQEFGSQATALWENDVASFNPKIETDLVEEARLEAEYTNALASAQVRFQGNEYNFSQLAKFRTDTDREIRHSANKSHWQWFDEKQELLDQIYDKQVKLRTKMAHKLGYKNFIELGYMRMQRIDYTQADVERFRSSVLKNVVPLTMQLRQEQAEALGLDKVMYWDEEVFDLRGNPEPMGGHDWMLKQAEQMFSEIDDRMKDTFQMMVESQLLDLKNRKDKAGGGFCTYFASHGIPYIFANFNGTKHDVEVFTHEFGHAFQSYSSRKKLLSGYFFPTYEACEIHSMSLEFLSWPYMEMFFGDDAERFRHIHLIQSLLFLPYGVAVDHFQHLVYENPDATPKERHALWRDMEETYLPWRDAGDLPHVLQGGQWQMQGHIYSLPFYYIDYVLALTCALQFWARSRQDYAEAVGAYIELCQRGGEVSFQQLVKGAGLTSPFEANCLNSAIEQAQQFLSAKKPKR